MASTVMPGASAIDLEGGRARCSRGRLARLALALACALVLSACGSVVTLLEKLPGSSLLRNEVRFDVEVASELNRGFPVAVDLVVVYDEDLLKEVGKLDATTWFAEREQRRRDSPQDLEAHSWEWVAGRTVERQVVRHRRGAEGAVLFAQYYTPGDHRAVVNLRRDFRLVLGTDDFSLEPWRR